MQGSRPKPIPSSSLLESTATTWGGGLEVGPWSLVLLLAGVACVVLTSLVGSFGALLLSVSGSTWGSPGFLFLEVSFGGAPAPPRGALLDILWLFFFFFAISAVFTGISKFLL